MAVAIYDPYVLRDALNAPPGTDNRISYGDEFMFYDGSAQSSPSTYRLVHRDSGNETVVLMKVVTTTATSKYRPSSTQDYDSYQIRVYDGSDIDQYLTRTFLPAMPAEYQKILKPRNIQVLGLQQTSKWNTVMQTIQRSVFAPSALELGYADSNTSCGDYRGEGSTFEYFQLSAKSKRGLNATYWTRTRDNAARWTESGLDNALCVQKDGSLTWAVKHTLYNMAVCINIRTDIIVCDSGHRTADNHIIWWITPDLPPNKVSSTIQTGSVYNDQTVRITWPSTTDPFNPTTAAYIRSRNSSDYPGISGKVGYVVREVLHPETGEPEENDYYVADSTEFETSFPYKKKVYLADYSVKAVDQWGNYSDWSAVASLSVSNNAPPYAPGNLTYIGNKKNEKISLTWAPTYDGNDRLDPDDNFYGYRVYRRINDVGELQEVRSGLIDTSFSEIAGDWDSVRYYVSAVDQNNAESDRTSVLIQLKSRTTVQVTVDVGSEIHAADIEEDAPTVTTGAEDTAHSITFLITETDAEKAGHDYSAIVSIVGAPNNRPIVFINNTAHAGDTITLTIPRDRWMELQNDVHHVLAFVRDNQDEDSQKAKNVYFRKSCATARLEISGENAILLDNPDITNVEQYMLQIDGEFPTGSSLSVQVSRNADAADPQDIEWENAVFDGTFVPFSSTAQGTAMGIRVTLNRGTATEPCYIKSIHGMFGRNWFKWIESVLRDNHLVT